MTDHLSDLWRIKHAMDDIVAKRNEAIRREAAWIQAETGEGDCRHKAALVAAVEAS